MTRTHQPDWQQGLSKPARRALAAAGIVRPEDLASWSESRLLTLHGLGPKAVPVLQAALRAQGLDFAPEHL